MLFSQTGYIIRLPFDESQAVYKKQWEMPRGEFFKEALKNSLFVILQRSEES